MENPRLPIKRSPNQPTLWRQAAPVLARGAALVALGVGAEIALSALAKGALRLPFRTSKSKALSVKRNGDLPEGTYAVSETVVMRRTIIRR